MIPKLLTPNTTNNIAKKLDLLIQMLTQTKQHLDRVEATQKSDKQELLEAIWDEKHEYQKMEYKIQKT